jgi:hypothetical protein
MSLPCGSGRPAPSGVDTVRAIARQSCARRRYSSARSRVICRRPLVSDIVAKRFCVSGQATLIQRQARMRNADSRIHSLDSIVARFYSPALTRRLLQQYRPHTNLSATPPFRLALTQERLYRAVSSGRWGGRLPASCLAITPRNRPKKSARWPQRALLITPIDWERLQKHCELQNR